MFSLLSDLCHRRCVAHRTPLTPCHNCRNALTDSSRCRQTFALVAATRLLKMTMGELLALRRPRPPFHHPLHHYTTPIVSARSHACP